MTRSGRGAPLSARALLRLVLVVLGAVVAGALATIPAAAHNVLISTNPVDGQRLAEVPAAVVLTFDEPALAMGTQLVVTGPGGPVQVGAPQLVDNTISQPLQNGAPPGTYSVAWRVTSADGHPVSGKLTFSAAAASSGSPVTAAPSAAPSPPPRTGSSTGIWAAGGGAVVLLVLVVAAIRRRSAHEVVGGEPRG